MAYKIEYKQLDAKTGRCLTSDWEDWWTVGERPEGIYKSHEEAQADIDAAVERNSDFVYTRLEFRVVKVKG